MIHKSFDLILYRPFFQITLPEIGTWSHFTISYDWSTTSLRVFVNGTQLCLDSNIKSGSTATDITNGLFALGQVNKFLTARIRHLISYLIGT